LRLVATHLKSVTIVLVLGYWLFAPTLLALVTPSLGRDETLTGRTDIWRVLFQVAARSPIVGLGYGGFWGLHPEITSQIQVPQGHNGYLDVYVELGAVGIALLTVFLLAYCGSVRKVFDKNFDWGVLSVCFLPMTLLYNLSESAFLTNGFLWTTMMFVCVLFSAATPPLVMASAETLLQTPTSRSAAPRFPKGRPRRARLNDGLSPLSARRSLDKS
jgi:O-antigen ligase